MLPSLDRIFSPSFLSTPSPPDKQLTRHSQVTDGESQPVLYCPLHVENRLSLAPSLQIAILSVSQISSCSISTRKSALLSQVRAGCPFPWSPGPCHPVSQHRPPGSQSSVCVYSPARSLRALRGFLPPSRSPSLLPFLLSPIAYHRDSRHAYQI